MSSWHDALDALVDVGNDAAPVILEAIDEEQDAVTRHWLMRTFTRLSHPVVIGPAKTWLASDDKLAHTYAIHALQSVAVGTREDAVRGEALDAIASVLDAKDLKTRRLAARALSRVRSPHTDKLMIAALDTADASVRDRAARYLGAAADNPTRPQYIAARSIVRELEAFAHASNGAIPGVDFSAFATDQKAQEQFSATIGAWLAWAKKQPTMSDRFFSGDRVTRRGR